MERRYGQEGDESNSNPPYSEPLFPHRNSPAPGESGSLKSSVFEDAHALAHTMGERFVSADCVAFLLGLGLDPLPGGVL